MRRYALATMAMVAITAMVDVGCDGVDPKDVAQIACEATCDGECSWHSEHPHAENAGSWICVPEIDPTPAPDPTPTPTPPLPPLPTPTPTPPPGQYFPPTFEEMENDNRRAEVRPSFEGRKGVGFTVWGVWGREHYCQPETNWPEACAEGRDRGPLAPDGPVRSKWEAHVMGQRCATFSYESDTHMSFDPWQVQHGVNQNHARNVRVCGQEWLVDDPSWVKVEHDHHLYIAEGQWAWATVHGNGRVCAEGKDGRGRTCKEYREP